MDNIIFLDIDGVLNNHHLLMQGVHIDPMRVLLINRVCAQTRAGVVISSSWRHIYSLHDLAHMLYRTGLSAGKVLGATPANGCLRGAQIAEFVQEHGITNYVIVDDSTDIRPEQHLRFIKTDFNSGLLPHHVERMIVVLEGGPGLESWLYHHPLCGSPVGLPCTCAEPAPVSDTRST